MKEHFDNKYHQLKQLKLYSLIYSNVLPLKPYALEGGCTLKIVEAVDDMFLGCNLDTKNKNSILIALPQPGANWADLVIFHSFISMYPETFEFAEETIKNSFAEDELTFLDEFSDSNAKNINKLKEIDFDNFPIELYEPNQEAINNITEILNNTDISDESSMNTLEIALEEIKPIIKDEIVYKDAFRLFVELHLKNDKLYNQISLFVFTRSLWQITSIYRNDMATIALYMAILESIIGRPKKCSVKLNCPECGRSNIDHDEISLRQFFINHFGDWLHNSQNIRNKFLHGVDRTNIIDALIDFVILDKPLDSTNKNMQGDIYRIESLVNKRLLEAFLTRYHEL